jgi:hypothetical protein
VKFLAERPLTPLKNANGNAGWKPREDLSAALLLQVLLWYLGPRMKLDPAECLTLPMCNANEIWKHRRKPGIIGKMRINK